MMIGPAPMMRIDLMSVRLGISNSAGTRKDPLGAGLRPDSMG
jgi:hypothetical protein